MSKINKVLILILIQLLFLLTIILIIPSIFIKELPGISQTSFETIFPLDQNHTYVQSFTTSRNYLNSISVYLKNPSLHSKDNVTIEVLDSQQNTIEKLETSGISIGDPSWIKLKFSPINSKKGDVYILKISSNSLKDNNLYIYGSPIDNSINFKTTYKNNKFTQSLKENLNFQKEIFTNVNKYYLLIYLLIIVSFNFAIIKLILF